MLNHLVEYANRTGKSERGFGAKRFPWGLVFDKNGAVVSLMPLDNEGKMREFPKCPEMSQNELVRDNRSQFLYERLGLLAGLPPRTGKAENYDKKRKSFITQLTNAAKVEPILEKIAATLASQETHEWLLRVMKEKRATNIQEAVLFVKERCLLEDIRLLDWWRTEYKRLRDAPSKAGKRPVSSAIQQARCLATGELTAPELRHPKIKGLKDVGGRGEDVLISFDKDAFSSYGMKKGANAVLGPAATAAYRDALNSLIGKHSKWLGGAKVVYWYDREVEEDNNPIGFLDWGKDAEGDDERDDLNALHKARQLLNSLQSGELHELGASRYFMLTLSGAAGRVMVRDWVEGQFGALARNVADWFEDMTIIHREGGRLAPSQKFISVLLALHSGLGDKASPDKMKRIPPPFAAKMWRVAVSGERLPDSVIAKALAQFRSDLVANADASPWARMNHARLGIIKAYFARQAREKGVVNHMTIGLNENHPNPAYHCGRLMAVLAAVQREALDYKVNAGVVERYYAAASSTPALVFGRLVRLTQAHVSKIAGKSAWRADQHQQQIAGIWDHVRERVPTTLSLEEQTLFAMGYYQQMAADRGGNVSDKGEKIETTEISKEA